MYRIKLAVPFLEFAGVSRQGHVRLATGFDGMRQMFDLHMRLYVYRSTTKSTSNPEGREEAEYVTNSACS